MDHKWVEATLKRNHLKPRDTFSGIMINEVKGQPSMHWRDKLINLPKRRRREKKKKQKGPGVWIHESHLAQAKPRLARQSLFKRAMKIISCEKKKKDSVPVAKSVGAVKSATRRSAANCDGPPCRCA